MSKINSQTNILIVAAWPYANGELHLGHVAGLIGSDFLARYFRLRGNPVLFISGSDCHGTPISIKAEELKIAPKEVAEKYDALFREELINGLHFSYDLFNRTMDQFHHKKVQEYFLDLYQKNLIYKKSDILTYCENCARFLPDRFVEGVCPKCNFDGARGDQCDECGSLLDSKDLIKPRCKICKEQPINKETEHFFLKLSAFKKEILEWVKNSEGWRTNARNTSLGFLENSLHDRGITRDELWGVPIPLSGYETKTIYVWFEAVLGYLTASQKFSQLQNKPELWRDFWQNENAYHYYVHGKDNITFHTIILPAILKGLGNLHLADKIVSSEYLTFENRQFSKSRKWGVWVGEFLAQYNGDLARYYLGINGPETADADFSWSDFSARINADLVGNLGNLINRVLSFIQSKLERQVPSAKNLEEVDKIILNHAQTILNEVGDLIEKAEFRNALKMILKFGDEANKYFNDQAPWKAIKENPERAYTVLNTCAQVISVLEVLLAPFIPDFADKIRKQLNKNSAREWKFETIKDNHLLGDIGPIFERVER